MGKPLDRATLDSLKRLADGEEISNFTLNEKSSMVWAWREHITSDIVPIGAIVVGMLVFIVISSTGFSFIWCLLAAGAAWLGTGVGAILLFDKFRERYSYDDLLGQVKQWAIRQSQKNAATKGKQTPYGWIALGVVALIAVFTVPSKAQHEAEIRTALTEEIARAETHSVGDLAAKWITTAINEKLKEDSRLSYIDVLGFEYSKALVVSVVRGRKTNGKDREVISIGLFNQVYVFNDD